MKVLNRFSSLSSRFLTVSVAVATLGSLLVFLLVETVTYRSLEQELEERMGRVADVSANVLAVPYWNLDTDNIEVALNGLLDTDDVVAVVARGQEGEILARAGTPRMDSSAGVLLTVRPVTHRSQGVDHPVGKLELYFTDAGIRRDLGRRIAIDLVLFAALLLALVISVVIAVRTSLSTPLERLLASLRRGGHGSSQPVDWDSPDELGRLVREYNRMLIQRSEGRSGGASVRSC